MILRSGDRESVRPTQIDPGWTSQTGERAFFRCSDVGDGKLDCVVDDHRPAGGLLFDGTYWQYFPGNGSKITFGSTSYSSGTRHVWSQITDGAGNVRARSSTTASLRRVP
jgi:hypothetical protein